MFILRIVPAVLLGAVAVLGFPVTNNGRAIESPEGFTHHTSLQGNEFRYGGHRHQEGQVSRYARGGLGETIQVGHRAHAEAVEQIRREILYDYLYGRALDHVKFQGQLASASEEHKAHIESLVRAHHEALPEGHSHKGATQAVVFKDFHHSPGEDTSGPKHVTLRFYRGAMNNRNQLSPAGHVYEQ